MTPFELDTLLWPACAIFTFTLCVTCHITRNPAGAILAALLKAGLFLVYFGLVFDGTFVFLDDWSYLEGGEALLAREVGILNLFNNWEYALMVGRGDHFIYYLYNAYAFKLFGEGYFAPVACNILLTVLIAFFGVNLAVREFGFSPRLSRWFYLFLLFHPDMLAWSNIMNGKDILVLFLHLLLLLSVSHFYQKRLRDFLLLSIPTALVLFFLRFYVPVLFVVALVAATILANRGRGRIRGRMWYLLLSGLLAALAFVWIGEPGIHYAISRIQEHTVNPLYGLLRMLLTPIPFHTEPAYAFLDIPAFIHWLFIPFVIIGVVRLFRTHTLFSRFFLIYLLIFIALYAVYGELQGPRHRVQLDYAFAVLQFLGMMAAMKSHGVLKRAHSPDRNRMSSFRPSP